VTKNNNFRDCNKQLLRGYSGTSAAKTVENPVNIIEMLPDKLADPRVLGNDFVAAVFGFETRGGSFDAAVIDEGPGNMRDFGFENVGDIFMENGDGIGPALR
jgi:hypothetical protein